MEPRLPTQKGIQMIAVYITFAFVTTVVFALRVYVRSRLIKRSWEDWAAGIGWFVYIVFCAAATVGPFYGTGQHADLLPPRNIAIALRQFYIAEFTYVASNLAVKLSIALMLLRVTIEPYQRKLVYIVTGTTQVYCVAFLFLFIFQCMPLSLFWTQVEGATEGKCINPKVTVVAGYVYLTVTIVYDWTMAILPWFIVRKMQLDLRTRRMIAVVLALGSIASITTLIRIPYVADLGSTKDFLYDNVNLAIWACIETGLSIIASSMTTLKPLFRKRGSENANPGRLTPKLNSVALTGSTAGSDPSTFVKCCESDVQQVQHVRLEDKYY